MDPQEGLAVKMLFSVAREFAKKPGHDQRRNLCSTAVSPQLSYLSLSLTEVADGLTAHAARVGTPRCHLLGFNCPIKEATGNCEGEGTYHDGVKRRLGDKLLDAHRAACAADKEAIATLLFQALELEFAALGDSKEAPGDWREMIELHKLSFEEMG